VRVREERECHVVVVVGSSVLIVSQSVVSAMSHVRTCGTTYVMFRHVGIYVRSIARRKPKSAYVYVPVPGTRTCTGINKVTD
jgi:hypothetical protein